MNQRQGQALRITCTTCIIKGNVTIEHFENIRSELVEALLASDVLLINMQEVETIDIEGIMLLCAVNRSAALRGKRVELAGGVSEELASRVAAAGFPRPGCIHRMNHACLWDAFTGAPAGNSDHRCRTYERTIRCCPLPSTD